MRVWVLVTMVAYVASPAAAQEGAPATVSVHGAAQRQLTGARQFVANGDLVLAIEQYADLLATVALTTPDALVPARSLVTADFVSVGEAVRLDLLGNRALLRAWRRAQAARADAARAAAHDEGTRRRIALRYPMTRAARIALIRRGDRQLEAGSAGLALNSYRRATQQLASHEPIADRLAGRLAAATRLLAATREALDDTYSELQGVASIPPPLGRQAAPRIPTITQDTVLISTEDRVLAFGRRAVEGRTERTLPRRWGYFDRAAAAQAIEARQLNEAAGEWVPNGLHSRVPNPAPTHDGQTPPLRVAVSGRVVVALLGRAAPAARALERARVYLESRAGTNSSRRRSYNIGDEHWDGTVPPPRTLVGLPLTGEPADGDGPRPLWRLGGSAGLPGLGAKAAFASMPLAVGGDVLVGAYDIRGEASAWLLVLDATTGRERCRMFCGAHPRQSARGPFGGIVRVPPGMALALGEGLCVVSANVGVVAAYDPAERALRWMRRYPRLAVSRRRGAASTAFVPPIIADGTVAVAPWDGSVALLLDLVTGRELARWDAPEGRWLQLLGWGADEQLYALQPTGRGPRLVRLERGPGLSQGSIRPVEWWPDDRRWVDGFVHGRRLWMCDATALFGAALPGGPEPRLRSRLARSVGRPGFAATRHALAFTQGKRLLLFGKN